MALQRIALVIAARSMAWRWVAGLALLTSSSGCSSPGAAPSASSAQDAGAGDDAGTKPCGPPPGGWEAGRDPPAPCVREVRGAVRVAGGGALASPDVSVCGRACFRGRGDATGAFRVPVNTHLPEGGYVLFVHGRPAHGSTFVRLPPSPPENVDLGTLVVPAFTSVGAALPADGAPATTVTAGAISLSVAADTTWDLAIEDLLDEAEGRKLRVAAGPAPDVAGGAALVYALGPFSATPSKKVGLRVNEAGGMSAGAAVEILEMAPLGLEGENAAGRMRIAARGHVSADGKGIETDPGEGLTVLTWVAIRPVR